MTSSLIDRCFNQNAPVFLIIKVESDVPLHNSLSSELVENDRVADKNTKLGNGEYQVIERVCKHWES